MKELIKKMPFIGKVAVFLNRHFFSKKKFTNSEEYWIDRYKKGGNSGNGSYNNLAEFKGEIINDFVLKNKIETVIELGCGDGNQLEYFKFKSYKGFDISNVAIATCQKKFLNDKTKSFFLMEEASDYKADLIISLDVLYHLIEDDVYDNYLKQLFELSNSYVIIYSMDSETVFTNAPHVKSRKFSEWIKNNNIDFTLINHIVNKYPFEIGKESTTSFSDFYIYKKNELAN